jgi:4'-phosphopantetheinyl transferase EntD
MADVLFDLELAHGRCVGVALPAEDAAIDAMAAASLVDEERAFAASLGSVRRRGWVGGRVALRQALAREGLSAPAVLADERGGPRLPPGVAGSVSHKESVAVALVAAEAVARLGVDVETDAPRRYDVSRKVLTDAELAELGATPADERAREVLLRFSAKEAVYKALDPFVRRYVGFREVEVRLAADGTARVTSLLPPVEGTFSFDVRWLRRSGLVLTTARVVPQ